VLEGQGAGDGEGEGEKAQELPGGAGWAGAVAHKYMVVGRSPSGNCALSALRGGCRVTLECVAVMITKLAPALFHAARISPQ